MNVFFFFQAEDGIRDAQESRGLGDVYKRQILDRPDGYAKIKGPCGDTMEMFLKIQNDKIVDITYTTDGCMTSHAAGSAATVMAKGAAVRECLKISQSTILEHLGGMPDESKHCALLAAKTFHQALRQYAVGKKR